MIKRSDKVLYDVLEERKFVSKEVLDSLCKEVESSTENLQQFLIKKGLVSEEDILNLLAEKLKIVYIDLKLIQVDKSVIDKVPLKVASYYNFLPIKIENMVLTVAVNSPLDIKTQDEIRTQLGYDIEMVLCSSEGLLDSLKKYYGLATETLEGIASEQTSQSKAAAPEEISSERIEDIEKLAGDASVIKLVNQIILEGWQKRATDIHIEPHRDKLSLRYRVDGLLYDANVSPKIKDFLGAIISRIKIMSNLNIVERRLPQDGAAVVRVQGQMLDLRISTIPTPFGESVVIRILPTKMLFSLEKLGLQEDKLQIFEELIKRPNGIIFVTGPTGSGKTTTLYACLNKLNTKERKIVTIEDPIEYEVPDIIQMQVIPSIGLDFARGLRSILRHDPDVIMVGEVRDLETAEIAIRVALTGHLIFSTLHTNDAASGITRLIDIGIEPYLVASSVEAFIAQRLIRLICSHCKYEDKTAPQDLKNLIAQDLKIEAEKIKIFRGKGCPQCNSTGFLGRTAIYEILLLDEEIKDLILRKVSSNEIKNLAITDGMQTLRQNGWQKVISGLTTPEEVLKVSPAKEHTTVADMPEVFSEPDFFSEESKQSFALNKRVFRRLNSKVNLSYRVFKSQQELLERGFSPAEFNVSKNISAGGLLFVSFEEIAVGSILELKIELPDGEGDIESLAKVIRVKKSEEGKFYDVAVCFLGLSGAQRLRLDKYVETELKE